ncbi:MAG: DNA repair protein RecO [Spirochaetota bacterium]
MNRYEIFEVIVLENRRIGEHHKGLSLFSAEHGIVRAIAFGGYSHKGSLRGVTVPFVYGTAYLYHEESRDRTKLTDMDVHSMFHGIREDLLRFYTAGMWAEMVLRSYGGGEAAGELFRLLRDGLTLLEGASEACARRLSAQVQLRYLELSGAPVDPDSVRDEPSRRFVRAAFDHTLSESLSTEISDADIRRVQTALTRRLERLLEGELRTVRSSGGLL